MGGKLASASSRRSSNPKRRIWWMRYQDNTKYLFKDIWILFGLGYFGLPGRGRSGTNGQSEPSCLQKWMALDLIDYKYDVGSFLNIKTRTISEVQTVWSDLTVWYECFKPNWKFTYVWRSFLWCFRTLFFLGARNMCLQHKNSELEVVPARS